MNIEKKIRLIEIGLEIAKLRAELMEAVENKDAVQIAKYYSLINQKTGEFHMVMNATEGLSDGSLREGERIIEAPKHKPEFTKFDGVYIKIY